MKQAKHAGIVGRVSMVVVLCILLSLSAAATVSDTAGLLSSVEKKILKDISGEDLCIHAAKEGNLNDTLALFTQKKKTCRMLLFYADREGKIRIAQPEQKVLSDTEVKQALLTFDEELQNENIRTAQDRKHAALMRTAEVLAAALAHVPQQSDLCTKIKDGVCEPTCPGADPDCLCGNGVCEYFEQDTCLADCNKKEWLCAAVQDGMCDSMCIITDIDCRLEAMRDQLVRPEKQQALGTSALIAGVGTVLLMLIALVIFLLHQRVESRKGISLIPSKVFLYFFALIALVAGMGLFIMIADRAAQTENTAYPGAEKAVALYRLVNSPDCFAVDGASVIDVSRFTQEQLDKCFMIPPAAAQKQCFKLELYDYRFGEQKIIKELQTTNFAQCATTKKIVKEPLPVLIAGQGTVKRGLLVVSSKKEE
ncbi:MAG: hypothetical protein Q7R76_02015 [Candidatus Woesearchaeota archaeon]|nr:hypothetical protein [Candidatus Woesearchaeota archaeon]